MQKNDILSGVHTNHKFSYQNIIFDDWNELRNYFFQLNDELINHGYVYRGHSDSNWKLEPSIERLKPAKIDPFFKAYYNHTELEFIKKYKRAIHLFDDTKTINSICNSNIDWLSLMQHHGAATRLLDVSASPFIASFFALSDVFSNSDKSCIWQFPLDVIDEINVEQLGIITEDKFQVSRFK